MQLKGNAFVRSRCAASQPNVHRPDLRVAASGIDTVFFTGGSSGIPRLRQRIAALLPRARAVEGDLFGSIGAGLAVDAARRYGTANGPRHS
jgi:UDP-N-acetylglucosamine:LPS N-acetylglucosamine transferase